MPFQNFSSVVDDLAVNGGDLTSTATTFNLLNATVTTLNIGGAATAISIGAATGTLTLNNPAVNFALAATVPTLYGSSAANGDLTLEGTSHATKTTSYVILQPTGGFVGIGTTEPQGPLHVTGYIRSDAGYLTRMNGSDTVQSGPQFQFSNAAGSEASSFQLSASNNVDLWQYNGGWARTVTFTKTGNVGIGVITPATLLELENITTITGAVTDGYSAALTLDPGYTAATAQTVTRHNYIDVQDVSVAGAGPAAVTNAAVLRFDAAVGTHKATVAASTKTTPGGVDGWIKMNVNGTLMYTPMYLSTTA